jgi:predicted amidohydrolase
MKIRVQQVNSTIGDIKGNTRQILSALEQARSTEIDLLILPEMCTSGYSPMDLLFRSDFLDTIDQANKTIIKSTQNTALIFGTVTLNRSGNGKPCFNSAVMAQNGKKVGKVHKTLLPTYDVYEETRYFEPNDSIHCIKWNDKKLGITICEDFWGNSESAQRYSGTVNIIQKMADQGADAIINLSASPFTLTKPENREKILQDLTGKIHRPIFFTNQTGGNASLIYDGHSMILDAQAKIAASAPIFEEAFIDAEWNKTGDVKATGTISSEKIH